MAVTSREAEVIRAKTEIRNAQSQLRNLVNDPRLVESIGREWTPQDQPLGYRIDVSPQASAQVAMATRPEIAEAMKRVKALSIQADVARWDLLPKLDLILRSYIAGLDDSADTLGAWENQWTQGRPTYGLGLIYEFPLGNRAANARLRRSRWELTREIHSFEAVVEQTLLDVDIAVREIHTAYREMVSKQRSVHAADAEVQYLDERWRMLPTPQDSAVLLLENLLDAQQRLGSEESAYATAQVAYARSWIALRRAMGTLLQFDCAPVFETPARGNQIGETVKLPPMPRPQDQVTHSDLQLPKNVGTAGSPERSGFAMPEEVVLPEVSQPDDMAIMDAGATRLPPLPKPVRLPSSHAHRGVIEMSDSLGQENRKDLARRRAKSLQSFERTAPLIAKIRDVHAAIKGSSPAAVKEHIRQLQTFVRRGESLASDKVLSLGAAIVNEAIQQILGKNLYDVQLYAGIALCRSCVAEMQTGEGKTLTGLMPSVLNALSGLGVHVATPNTYLAQRDHDLLKPVIEHLGLTVGLLTNDNDVGKRAEAYACDITYGPGYAFGFDYLRDQLALRSSNGAKLGEGIRKRLRGLQDQSQLMQRSHHFAILDEIDHVLIDDAMSPLILSSTGDGEAPDAHIHQAALGLLDRLEVEKHFTIASSGASARLTSEGISRVYDENSLLTDVHLRRPLHEYVNLALRAKYQFRRDIHYVVVDEEVRIIDGTTGRIFEDRSWNDGQHQAVEAKEGLRITEERVALARITRQRFYRMYDSLSGMTGTATGCEDELARVYGLPIISVPLRVPSQRRNLATIISKTQEEKTARIASEAVACSRRKQPVLVGTLNIADSLSIADSIESHHLPYQLLNGTQNADEADVVAKAGDCGAITIATNLAGRGTDIHIGPDAAASGGLHVVVSEHHPLQRVDRQLVGRSGRQGDPGSMRVFVALEDDVLKSAPWIARWIERRLTRGEVESDQLAQMILSVQRRNQKQQTSMRLQMLRHDLSQQKLLDPTGDNNSSELRVARVA